ncbi:MAG: hypothetical protein Q8R92_12830 [Deltaproteobacteria bacterium]|nr:hypothetical protein [Deltaproteobacteria bacterium]
MRRLTFTVLAGLAAALPYSLSGVSGWRYFTDIGVWVALCWGQLADPFVASRRFARGMVLLCALMSLINILSTQQIRSTYDWLGRATYLLCAEIEGSVKRMHDG